MIRISNLDQLKASLRGFVDGVNRLSFGSDVVQEVQENIRGTPDLSSDRNEAFRQSVYQNHLKHDDKGMEDAINHLPAEDRDEDKIRNDLIGKYITDYLRQKFSEI